MTKVQPYGVTQHFLDFCQFQPALLIKVLFTKKACILRVNNYVYNNYLEHKNQNTQNRTLRYILLLNEKLDIKYKSAAKLKSQYEQRFCICLLINLIQARNNQTNKDSMSRTSNNLFHICLLYYMRSYKNQRQKQFKTIPYYHFIEKNRNWCILSSGT